MLPTSRISSPGTVVAIAANFTAIAVGVVHDETVLWICVPTEEVAILLLIEVVLLVSVGQIVFVAMPQCPTAEPSEH